MSIGDRQFSKWGENGSTIISKAGQCEIGMEHHTFVQRHHDNSYLQQKK